MASSRLYCPVVKLHYRYLYCIIDFSYYYAKLKPIYLLFQMAQITVLAKRKTNLTLPCNLSVVKPSLHSSRLGPSFNKV